jgi:hypothetical protein
MLAEMTAVVLAMIMAVIMAVMVRLESAEAMTVVMLVVLAVSGAGPGGGLVVAGNGIGEGDGGGAGSDHGSDYGSDGAAGIARGDDGGDPIAAGGGARWVVLACARSEVFRAKWELIGSRLNPPTFDNWVRKVQTMTIHKRTRVPKRIRLPGVRLFRQRGCTLAPGAIV